MAGNRLYAAKGEHVLNWLLPAGCGVLRVVFEQMYNKIMLRRVGAGALTAKE